MAVALCAPNAGAASDAQTIGTGTEAWYATTPFCGGAISCPEFPVDASSRYSPATLHVGVDAGTETSRTYLVLPVTPALVAAHTARLILPLAPQADGTEAPELAKVEACLASAAPPAVRGSFATPPAINCDVRAAATYNPVANALAVDLGVFLPKWSAANTGLALIPSASADPQASWHIAIPAKDHAGAAHIVATFDLAAADPGSDAVDLPEISVAADVFDLASPSLIPVDNLARRATRAAASGDYDTSAASAAAHGFMQPIAFAIPLLLVALLAQLATSAFRPVGDDA